MRIVNRYIFVLSAAVPLFLAGIASALDSVDYRDPTTGQVQNTKGSILEEGVGGITMRASGGAATIKLAPSQIVQVIYDDLPKGLNLDYPVAVTAEKEREYDKARQQYEKLLPMIPPGTNSRRQAEFRIAMLNANLVGGSEEEGVSLLSAISGLKDFINTYPGSWQFTAASQTLARLQLSDSRFDDALSTLQKLGDAPGLPDETKLEVDLMSVDALLRADGRKAEAKQKIDALLSSLPNGAPQRQSLEIYGLLADETTPLPKAVETLKDVIAKSPEPAIRGLAYNTLGDFYTLNGKKRDAMWSHLWVDVVYSQDTQQHMYAVSRLIKIFDDLGEQERSKLYMEKLKTLR